MFNETQTPGAVYRLAETCAFVFGNGSYGIGWDGRKTSALLSRTVLAAISAIGSEARLFGLVPTPVMAFGTRSRSCLVGFSVTASHNPPEFSGVKVFNGRGMELAETDEERIERALALDVMKSSGKFGSATPDGEVVDDYVNGVLSRYEKASNPLKIAIDCSNGPGGNVTPRILKALGHDALPLNAQVSWHFPAHPPEPTANNLADFARLLPNMKVDFGFAHDGDADRLVMVDRFGNVVPDSVVTIIALRGLGPSSGSVVISENTSSSVEEEARNLGCKVVRSRVGKSFALLEKSGGVFASEPSKIVDPRWGYWEDGINAAALISGALTKERSLLDRLVSRSKWHYKQVNLQCKVVMSVLAQKARETFRRFGIAEERRLDGLKLILDDESWVMFRPSGTEPKTRLYCESRDAETLNLLVAEGTKCVELSL